MGAVYSSSSNFNSSTGTLSGGQTVGNRSSASVAVSSSKNPAISGDTVVFSATVGPVAPAVGTPGGSVQFVIDGANAGGPVALSGGLAMLSTGALDVGGHTVVANYSGDASFQSSLGLLAGGQSVVLGPQVASSAPSGGYWLFGSRRRPLPRGVFAGIVASRTVYAFISIGCGYFRTTAIVPVACDRHRRQPL